MENYLFKLAKKHKIPYQVTAEPRGTGTDANAMQLSRGGTATGLISIPNRYMHTPVEVVALKDITRTSGLLAAFIAQLEEDFLEKITLDGTNDSQD